MIYHFYLKEWNWKGRKGFYIVIVNVLHVIHIRHLKQTLNYRLVLKKVHWVIKFIQSAWLKLYIDLNS